MGLDLRARTDGQHLRDAVAWVHQITQAHHAMAALPPAQVLGWAALHRVIVVGDLKGSSDVAEMHAACRGIA